MNCVDISQVGPGQQSWTLPVAAGLPLQRPAAVMAIVNITPDSFSDGGRYCDPETVRRHVAELIQHHGDELGFLDIGAESTRPGATPVSAADELQRLQPILEALRAMQEQDGLSVPPISVDTSKASVAAKALSAGAFMVNDISAGRDPDMFAVVADAGVPLVLMHMQGTPETMQHNPHYENVVDEICDFFDERISAALDAGIDERLLIIDPGIGFGKTLEQNLCILRSLDIFHRRLQRPLLVGLSRKSFLPKVMGRELDAAQRDHWSHLFHARIANHCEIMRVHDVAGALDARAAAAAMWRGEDV